MGQPFIYGLAVGRHRRRAARDGGGLTLLPAMLGFAGRAIDRLHVPGLLRSPAPGDRASASGTGGAGSSSADPWLCGSPPWSCCWSLAMPLFSMQLAFTDSGNDPAALTTRQAYDLLCDGFGPGFNGPLVVAADLPGGPATAPWSTALDARLAADPGRGLGAPRPLQPRRATRR